MAIENLDKGINYIEFNVRDITQTKEFYEQVFGWTFIDYGPDYCEFNDGQIKGGFTTQGDVELGGPMIVLYSQNLESLRDLIVKKGGEIVNDIFDFPGGQRFEFKDVNGYLLGVWRPA